MTYSEKLKDIRWKTRRARIILRDGCKCQFCGCNHHLEVHHKRYIKSLEPWEYENEDVITLCHFCHSSIHKGKIRAKIIEKTSVKHLIYKSIKSIVNG